MILIEKDCDLIHNLKSSFREYENSLILNIDILKYNLDSLNHSVRVVGNLPYNISTEIIFKMCNCTKIIDMHFMLQKEFAERCAGNENSKSYGKLSVICDYLFEVSILKDVDKSFFIPPPKVDSAFVRFKPKRKTFNEIEFVNLKKILNPLFNAKRKKIGDLNSPR